MRAKTITRILVLAGLCLLAISGTAQAKQIQQYFYTGKSFGVGGSSPMGIAFDGADQTVLVVDNADKTKGLKVSKFHLEGSPAPFADLFGEPSFNIGGALSGGNHAAAIAVDESATASSGNFYVASRAEGKVYGYAPGGKRLAGFPIAVPGACGIGVSPTGTVWTASDLLGLYGEFTSTGSPTGRFLSFSARHGGCQITIDSAGNFYLVGNERVAKYDSARHFVGDIGPSAFEGPSTLGLAFDRSSDTLFELFSYGGPLVQTDSSGDPLASFGGPDPAHFSYEGLLGGARSLAVDPQTHDVYVLKGNGVDVFSRDGTPVTVPSVTTGEVEDLTGTSATIGGSLDPDGIDTTECRFEWGDTPAYGKTVPCAEGDVFSGGSGVNEVSASIGGLEKGTTYHYRLVSENANGVLGFARDREFAAADPPVLSEVSADHITSEGARINLAINTNGADSTYRVEIGTDTSYGMSFPVPDAKASSTRPVNNFEEIEVILVPQPKTQEISGALEPETEYHYQIVAENPAGAVASVGHTFTTFALPTSGEDPCPNAQARQQTSAAGLLDCRAYELVSAPDTGGYDVRSDLSPGVSALPTSPNASDATLYSMNSGTIPGVAGHPTNRGADPYLARRGANGWSTRYLGLPANNPFATAPFASPLSGFDSALDTFSFGGSEICSPCFADGSTDVPLRLPDGSLVQGMAGSIDPAGPANPAGEIREPLSADGGHFLFGTTAQFEPSGNSNGTDATIYSRDLKAQTTEVVSTDESGQAIANGDGVAALGVSEDGSRVVIGEKLSTDAAGNEHHHLYLHIAGTDESVDLTPGTTSGALYSGMPEDGTRVFYTTSDALTGEDTDTSADVYEVEVGGPGPVTPKLISSGTGGAGNTDACSPPGDPNWNAVSGSGKCNVVAFAGGAGVAADEGTFYFLSPEKLDGAPNGVQDQANLYLVEPGFEPHFVETIDSSLVKLPPSPPTRPTLTTEFGGSHILPGGLTVDQSNGDVYVTEGGSTLSRFTSAGAPNVFTEGPGAGTNKISGLSFVESAPQVAIDNSGGPLDGSIYVTNNPKISIFSQSGNPLGQLTGFGEVCGVAVDQSNGDVYVGDCFGKIWRYAPISATPPISNANYAVTGIETGTESAAVAADNGNVYASTWSTGPVRQYSVSQFGAGFPLISVVPLNAKANALSVDPVTHELYVDEGNQIVTFNPAGEKQLTIGSGQISSSRGVGVNATSHHVYASQLNGKLIEFGYEVFPYEPIDNPAIVHGVRQAGVHDSSDFQVTPDGVFAAFTSVMPLTGHDSGGRYAVFRYEAESDALACISCSPTGARPTGNATLTPYGRSLTDDGRVFFTTAEPLTLRDSNEKKDAYQWTDGKQELISTGTSESDSSLLSVSADGKNAFFFTRQKLVPEDENGSRIRLYTAREGGGYAFGPPTFECAASDECHGPSSEAPRPLSATTVAGAPGQFQAEPKPKCRKGKVRRRGRCVKRNQSKRQQHNRANAKRGGGK